MSKTHSLEARRRAFHIWYAVLYGAMLLLVSAVVVLIAFFKS